MIKTNEWTINDLTRYLVSVKSSLKEEELRRLRLTAAFPKEGSEADKNETVKPRRLRADQLYEPLPAFRQLGLPIIDWGVQTKWRSNSDEGRSYDLTKSIDHLKHSLQHNFYLTWDCVDILLSRN